MCTAPTKKHTTDTAAAHSVTLLKLRHTRMAVSAGKMIRLEISMVPITRMPSTMVTAVSRARSMLQASACPPRGAGEGFIKGYGKDAAVKQHKQHKHRRRQHDAQGYVLPLMASMLPNR